MLKNSFNKLNNKNKTKMERIIKFRGKREDNGEWVEGGYFGVDEDGDALHTFILTNCQTRDFTSEHSVFTGHKVDKKTFGQFTELQDKNGVEIYEGDIVRFCDDPPNCHDYIIKYDEERLLWIADGVNDFMEDLWEIECEFVRVIGNIYDDSEMLEL